jgi:hypothetical protein
VGWGQPGKKRREQKQKQRWRQEGRRKRWGQTKKGRKTLRHEGEGS